MPRRERVFLVGALAGLALVTIMRGFASTPAYTDHKPSRSTHPKPPMPPPVCTRRIGDSVPSLDDGACMAPFMLSRIGVELHLVADGNAFPARVEVVPCGVSATSTCEHARGLDILARLFERSADGTLSRLYAIESRWVDSLGRGRGCGWRLLEPTAPAVATPADFGGKTWSLEARVAWFTEGGTPWATERQRDCSVQWESQQRKGGARVAAPGGDAHFHGFNWLSNRWLTACEWCAAHPLAMSWSASVDEQVRGSISASEVTLFNLEGYPNLLGGGVFTRDIVSQHNKLPNDVSEEDARYVSGSCKSFPKEVYTLGLSRSRNLSERLRCFDAAHVTGSPVRIRSRSPGPLRTPSTCRGSKTADMSGHWASVATTTTDGRLETAGVSHEVTWPRNEVPVFIPVTDEEEAAAAARGIGPYAMQRPPMIPPPGKRLEWRSNDASCGAFIHFSARQLEASLKRARVAKIIGDGIIMRDLLRRYPTLAEQGLLVHADAARASVATEEVVKARSSKTGESSTGSPVFVLSLFKFCKWGKEISTAKLRARLRKTLLKITNEYSKSGTGVNKPALGYIVTVPAMLEFSWAAHTGPRARAYNTEARKTVAEIQHGTEAAVQWAVLGFDKITAGRPDARSPYALKFANWTDGTVLAATNVLLNSIVNR